MENKKVSPQKKDPLPLAPTGAGDNGTTLTPSPSSTGEVHDYAAISAASILRAI